MAVKKNPTMADLAKVAERKKKGRQPGGPPSEKVAQFRGEVSELAKGAIKGTFYVPISAFPDKSAAGLRSALGEWAKNTPAWSSAKVQATNFGEYGDGFAVVK